MFAERVFTTIADRFAARGEAIAMFLETGATFQPWCLWEAFAACRRESWTVRPVPGYNDVGLMGSRESADLLVVEPATDSRVLVELSIIHDWGTNRWIAELNHDTANLSRQLTSGVVPLQVILAASLQGPVEVNRQWKSWLDMTEIWRRPTTLSRSLKLGERGEGVLRGWVVGKK